MTGGGLPGLRLAGSLLVLATLVALWQAVTTAGWISPVFLPSADATWTAILEGYEDGTLPAAVLGTVGRMLAGFCLAAALGTGLGLAIGLSPRLRAWLEPSLEFLRPLPASAIIPVAILLLGLTKTMILAVIVFGSLWPTLLATVAGIKAVEPRLFEVSRTLELSRHKLVAAVVLPSALPEIFAGLRLALTVSLILAVVTEMMSGEPGLGATILLAARSFRSPELYAGVAHLGLIGLLANSVMEFAHRRLAPWQVAPS